MEVILLERIARLGQMGETVKVRDGFARNFLLPQGKALRANAANKKKFEGQRAQLETRNNERRSEAEKVAGDLDGKTFVVVRSAGETGQLYGSVSTRDIADILTEGGFTVARRVPPSPHLRILSPSSCSRTRHARTRTHTHILHFSPGYALSRGPRAKSVPVCAFQ